MLCQFVHSVPVVPPSCTFIGDESARPLMRRPCTCSVRATSVHCECGHCSLEVKMEAGTRKVQGRKKRLLTTTITGCHWCEPLAVLVESSFAKVTTGHFCTLQLAARHCTQWLCACSWRRSLRRSWCCSGRLLVSFAYYL